MKHTGRGVERLGRVVALGLALLTAVVVGAGAAQDVATRERSPEAAARRYFAALQTEDPDGALQELAPAVRESGRPFVEHHLGNRYRVVGVAAEYPSLWERLAQRAPDQARTVTVFLDITQKDGARWQAGPRVPVVYAGGRAYLGQPPLT